MSKKDFASITTDLSALAQTMPTQRPAVSEPPALKVVAPPGAPARDWSPFASPPKEITKGHIGVETRD